LVLSATTPPDLPSLVGEAPSFQAILAQVSQLAVLDRPLLVVGERGTGKELIAARLTYLSPRWDRPLVKLNCATLAESLLDSELFGHEAGAFTGASRRRLSRFEIADGGTLFLDEIANASLAVQEKILRVIEYGTFERVGGNDVHRVDVRVIAATNVDLPTLAEEGRFRSDLLDRLAFDVVTVPPLRERAEDIPLLADHYGRSMTRELGGAAFSGFTRAAMDRLAAHSWPGNVRELKNVVERSVHRWSCPEKPVDELVFDPFASPHRPRFGQRRAIPPQDLGGAVSHAWDNGSLLDRVSAYEKRLLGEALSANEFNQRRTAAALSLTYDQLRHLLKKHGLLGRLRQPATPT
jgi:psp operon transcriptional activator